MTIFYYRAQYDAFIGIESVKKKSLNILWFAYQPKGWLPTPAEH